MKSIFLITLLFLVINQTCQFEFSFQFTKFSMKKHSKAWPKQIAEKYYKGLSPVETVNSKKTECHDKDKCRPWFSIKEEALRQVSDHFWPEDKTLDLYYVMTQKHTLSEGEYGQFLFSHLATEAKKSSDSKLKLASICVPVLLKDKAFILTKCALDTCDEHKDARNREKKCNKVYDEKDHRIEEYTNPQSQTANKVEDKTEEKTNPEEIVTEKTDNQLDVQDGRFRQVSKQNKIQKTKINKSLQKSKGLNKFLLKKTNSKKGLNKLLIKKLKLSQKTYLQTKQNKQQTKKSAQQKKTLKRSRTA